MEVRVLGPVELLGPDGAEAHFLTAIDIAEGHGWSAAVVEAQLWLARTLLRRDAVGDADAARSLLGAVLDVATRLELVAAARESAELLDVPNPFARSERRPTRRDRARAFVVSRGFDLVGRWTSGATDDELWRRFGQEKRRRSSSSPPWRGRSSR